jgi:hypothetical protein
MADKETVELIMKVVTDQFSKELKGVQEQMRRMPDVQAKGAQGGSRRYPCTN